MKLGLEIVHKNSDSDFPVLDIIAYDIDSAFQLGEIFNKLTDMTVLRIDGHGIRIILQKFKGKE